MIKKKVTRNKTKQKYYRFFWLEFRSTQKLLTKRLGN